MALTSYVSRAVSSASRARSRHVTARLGCLSYVAVSTLGVTSCDLTESRHGGTRGGRGQLGRRVEIYYQIEKGLP